MKASAPVYDNLATTLTPFAVKIISVSRWETAQAFATLSQEWKVKDQVARQENSGMVIRRTASVVHWDRSAKKGISIVLFVRSELVETRTVPNVHFVIRPRCLFRIEASVNSVRLALPPIQSRASVL